MKKSYALLTVSEKEGIVECARELVESGLSLLATEGTARVLKEAGLEVKTVREVTDFPPILEGRVKTLHPRLLGGILASRENSLHQRDLEDHDIPLIPVVIANLYPFEETVKKPEATEEEIVENIDIGGVTLLRAAAKNYREVLVITEGADYHLASEWQTLDIDSRKELARRAWKRVLDYDQIIFHHFHLETTGQATRGLNLELEATPRYGENPHQQGAFWRFFSSEKIWTEITGRPLSYNNYLDISAALISLYPFDRPGALVTKHTNPCGAALSHHLQRALELAWQGDSLSAFGSIVAVNRPLKWETYQAFLKGKFIEILCAPDFDQELIEYVEKKHSRLRLVQWHPEKVESYLQSNPSYRSLLGGVLSDEWDLDIGENWESVTDREFPEELLPLARFGVRVNGRLLSNAISLVSGWRGHFWQSGMGAGQPNRVGALEHLALPLFERNISELAEKLGQRREELEKEILEETVLISDGFFPFPDSIEIAGEAGIRYLVQPGGSKRDGEVIEACNERGMAMIFTGYRHFRH